VACFFLRLGSGNTKTLGFLIWLQMTVKGERFLKADEISPCCRHSQVISLQIGQSLGLFVEEMPWLLLIAPGGKHCTIMDVT